ncbi:signal-transducing adaptor protein 2 isoform X5 [Larus michahellis]|uniref:signal-transducing adaptor protein 2 isoform X5 n=1 Tax=Larus michahellis TaxID=119627 RepID=UPI003D9ACCF6
MPAVREGPARPGGTCGSCGGGGGSCGGTCGSCGGGGGGGSGGCGGGGRRWPGRCDCPGGTDPGPSPSTATRASWRSGARGTRSPGGSGPGCGGSHSPSTGSPGTTRLETPLDPGPHVWDALWPLELLDLSKLVAVWAQGGDLILQLRGQGQKVTLKAESWEAQEMWRGFILTMVEMKVPTDLALLPGHLFQLSEALREEWDRRATPRSPATRSPPATPGAPKPPLSPVPSCFFEVTRLEAEGLLERSVGRGNMVLRPRGHGQGVSVTTRQEMNGMVLLRHYRVNHVDQGYIIDVDTQHRCSSLAEVVQYFVESSKGSLQPLHREYSSRLEFVEMDGENAEETQRVCEPPPAAPTPPPRRLSALKPSSSPHRPALQSPGGPEGPPPFGAIPKKQTYMNMQDMVDELAKKLQLRRALIED